MHRLKRLWELVKLSFKALREDGVQYTLHRLVGFLHRRLRSKKGRFLPPRAELERQRREDTSNWPKISICTTNRGILARVTAAIGASPNIPTIKVSAIPKVLVMRFCSTMGVASVTTWR